jgi:hypothetical protein
MILYAVNKTKDKIFHLLFYRTLLQRRPNALLHINSPYIEEFLLTNDPILLYSYYMQGADYQRIAQYMEAAQLMHHLAKDNQQDCLINKRIEYLQNAITSAKAAAQRWSQQQSGGMISSSSSSSLFMQRPTGTFPTTPTTNMVPISSIDQHAKQEIDNLFVELTDLLDVAGKYIIMNFFIYEF